MKRDGRLPESELDIMLAVWEAGEKGATAPGILEGLARPLTASALHSYLKRLEDKGFLTCRKEGRTNRYFPLRGRPVAGGCEGAGGLSGHPEKGGVVWKTCSCGCLPCR